MKIVNSILTKNPCYTANRKIKVKGLMLHSVGCPQPKASVFVKSWNKESYNRACVHAFIDGNTGEIYQCLPWDHRGWHAGGSANNTHIGVEMCEPSTIKYVSGAGWKEISDGKNTKDTVVRTYNAAVELFAKLCNDYKLDPLKDGVIISHSEGYKRGVASNHGDVEHIWKKFSLSMDKFRKDVYEMMKKNAGEVKPEAAEKIIYKVQVGAYTFKKNADKQLAKLNKDGFDGFIVKVGKFYKVQVGAYSIKGNAANMVKKLKSKGYDCFVTAVVSK